MIQKINIARKNDNFIINIGATATLFMGNCGGYMKPKYKVNHKIQYSFNSTNEYNQTTYEVIKECDDIRFIDQDGNCVHWDCLSLHARNIIGLTNQQFPCETSYNCSKHHNHYHNSTNNCNCSQCDRNNTSYRTKCNQKHFVNTSNCNIFDFSEYLACSCQECKGKSIQRDYSFGLPSWRD